MIKKNILVVLMLLLTLQVPARAMTYDEIENFSDKLGSVYVGMNKEGKLALQKKRDKRRLWIIAGGVAIVSLAVGAAVVAFYCNGKVNKLAHELDKTRNSLINLDGNQEHRISVAQARLKELDAEIERLQDQELDSEFQAEIELMKLEADGSRIELTLAFDIEKCKVKKEFAEIDLQINNLRPKYFMEKSIEVQKLDLERERLELELERCNQRLLYSGHAGYLEHIQSLENDLNKRAQELATGKQESNIDGPNDCSDDEEDMDF